MGLTAADVMVKGLVVFWVGPPWIFGSNIMCKRLQNRFGNERQQHGDACAAAQRAVDVNQTSAPCHDVVDRGQAEAGAPARGLGGEKSFEEVAAGFRVHALTVVADH